MNRQDAKEQPRAARCHASEARPSRSPQPSRDVPTGDPPSSGRGAARSLEDAAQQARVRLPGSALTRLRHSHDPAILGHPDTGELERGGRVREGADC